MGVKWHSRFTRPKLNTTHLRFSYLTSVSLTILTPCCTCRQAKALLKFVEAISEKRLRSTVSLTAGRGRGKSAALGLAIAAAVGFQYSNIFVTSPSPENLNTLFEFVLKGFDAMDYQEHLDYELIQSTNPEFNKAVVRVNVFKEHRQTIQVGGDSLDYQEVCRKRQGSRIAHRKLPLLICRT